MRKYYAIIGKPVSHSSSPRMHNSAFEKLKMDSIYTRYLLNDGAELKKKFLSLGLSGANVTVPYKEDAFNQCDEVMGIAKDIKAVNTIILNDKKLIGYNTDAPGFMQSIKEFYPLKSALILGAGGTAKAISLAMKKNGIYVSVVNRSEKRLKAFDAYGFDLFTWDSFTPKSYDIIVNTTSAGLNDDSLPMPKNMLDKLLSNAKFAFDVIYHKDTPFIKMCKDYNVTYKNGKDMLLYQGVLAFELFTGVAQDDSLICAFRDGLELG